MEPCFTLLPLHLHYLFPNTALSSRRGAMKPVHVVRVREYLQYSFATILGPICTFWQAQRCKSQLVLSPSCPPNQTASSKKRGSGIKSCEASHILALQAAALLELQCQARATPHCLPAGSSSWPLSHKRWESSLGGTGCRHQSADQTLDSGRTKDQRRATARFYW